MLRRFRWIGALAICVSFGTAAGAEEPRRPAASAVKAQEAPRTGGWDDSHMRSNHNGRPAAPVTRPPIQGSSGYGALAAGTSETRTEVPVTLETTTQRGWEQGPLRTLPKQEAKKSSSSGSGISRGSQLRAGSVSSGRR